MDVRTVVDLWDEAQRLGVEPVTVLTSERSLQ
jgi:hypothetical protein